MWLSFEVPGILVIALCIDIEASVMLSFAVTTTKF